MKHHDVVCMRIGLFNSNNADRSIVEHYIPQAFAVRHHCDIPYINFTQCAFGKAIPVRGFMVVIATHTGYVFDPDSYVVWQPASGVSFTCNNASVYYITRCELSKRSKGSREFCRPRPEGLI